MQKPILLLEVVMAEYDIALFADKNYFKGTLPVSLEKQKMKEKEKVFRLYKDNIGSLEYAILDFLDLVNAYDSDAFRDSTIMLIGVYHDTMTHTVRLTERLIKELCKKKISLEIVTYPCDDG